MAPSDEPQVHHGPAVPLEAYPLPGKAGNPVQSTRIELPEPLAFGGLDVETLLLQGRGHKRDREDGLLADNTIKFLQAALPQGKSPSPVLVVRVPPSAPSAASRARGVKAAAARYVPVQSALYLPSSPAAAKRAAEATWLPPVLEIHAAGVPSIREVAFPRRPDGAAPGHGLLGPRARKNAAVALQAYHERMAAIPFVVPLPVVPCVNHKAEALSFLTALVRAFTNEADCSALLVAFYHKSLPAPAVLADWLAAQPQNPHLWSRLHHRVRWRSHQRHLSLLNFAESAVPATMQPSRRLTYVKGWMAELDDQESQVYKSTWLRQVSNRGNLARFFRLAPNFQLMAGYLEQVLTAPPQRGLLADAGKAFARIDKAVGQVQA